MNQYSGGCLCGACSYVITGQKPEAMYLCHCSRCRKETGTAYGATIFFADAQLSWDKGENNLSYFHLEGTRKNRSFCKTCGSPLPRLENNGYVVLPAGTLDDDTAVEPTAHIYYANRSSWECKTGHLRCFDELPG